MTETITIEERAQIERGTASNARDGVLHRVWVPPLSTNRQKTTHHFYQQCRDTQFGTDNVLPDSNSSIPLAKCDTVQDWVSPLACLLPCHRSQPPPQNPAPKRHPNSINMMVEETFRIEARC
jgi:hypothetical protein